MIGQGGGGPPSEASPSPLHTVAVCSTSLSSSVPLPFASMPTSMRVPPSAQVEPGAIGVRRMREPGAPIGPAGPAGPVTPAGPASPCGPCDPSGPAGPGGPASPRGPRGPCTPAGPGGPDCSAMDVQCRPTHATRLFVARTYATCPSRLRVHAGRSPCVFTLSCWSGTSLPVCDPDDAAPLLEVPQPIGSAPERPASPNNIAA